MTKHIISKFLLGVFLLAGLSSCDLFKPAQDSGKDKVYKDNDGNLEEIQGKKVYNPQTGEWEIINEISGKLDTVRWVDLPPNKFPPITSDGFFDGSSTTQEAPNEDGSIVKSNYNLTYLLPFNTQFLDMEDIEISRNSQWAINFYGGAQLAFEMLRGEGINMRVHVYDTKGDAATINEILMQKEEVQNTDVVIGPYLRKNVRTVAQWAKNQDKLLVSPFSASMQITQKNPNYLQVNPSIAQHCRAIMNHALTNYEEEDIVIVGRDEADERAFLNYLQTARNEYNGLEDISAITEYIVRDETADFREMDVASYINEGGTTVFIVPSYKSETFVYSLLRQLAISKSEMDKVVVYGLPPWQDFTRIDFDYYENLNVHISAGSFVDNFDPDVRLFKRKYYDRFGIPPREEAFLGYDVTLYTGRMLQKYGTKFQFAAESEEPKPYLQSAFNFERIVFNPDRILDDSKEFEIDQFENKAVHILKFDNYYFQPAE